MRPILIVLLVILVLPYFSFSQNSLIKTGMNLFEQKEYDKALPYFEKLANENNNITEALRMASICNSKIGNFKEAEQWASKLLVLEKVSAENYELYFNTLVDNGKYESALEVLGKYKEKGFHGTILNAFVNEPNFWMNNYLDTCSHKITRMGLNSYRPELIPAVHDDLLYFGSISNSQSGNRSSLNLYYAKIIEDTSIAVRKNTLKETNECFKDSYINFSKDGKIVFLTKIDKDKKLMQLYYGESKLIKMDELKAFKYNSKEHSVGRATLSSDGTKLVFSSDRNGSLGQVDLWMCTVDDKWNLSEPVNLGDKINTNEDDVLPYFGTNERLYFASEGHIGFGRFDLYYTDYRDGEFQQPVNLGSPVNTNADDMGICYSEKHDKYFFASDRKGNFDIYSYQQLEEQPQVIGLPELANKQEQKKADRNFYFAVQVMASRSAKDKAVQSFKKYMKGKSLEFTLVKEDIWLKFRTGHFLKREQAEQFAMNAGFENYFVVQMSDNQVIETIQIN